MLTQKAPQNRNAPLLVMLVGTMAMVTAWLLTPRFGPWPCHGIAAPVSIIVALRWRIKPVRMPHSVASILGSFALGALLATLSWWLAPSVTRWMPAFGGELGSLYATLNRSPGPTLAVPILALTILAEELIWRGVLVDWCLTRLNSRRTVLLATAAYALPMMFSGSWLLLLVAIGLGAVLAVERLYCRTWIAPFITHLTWNLLVFVVHPLM